MTISVQSREEPATHHKEALAHGPRDPLLKRGEHHTPVRPAARPKKVSFR